MKPPCAGDARRDQALEVAADTLGADALSRVGEEHEQRQHERTDTLAVAA